MLFEVGDAKQQKTFLGAGGADVTMLAHGHVLTFRNSSRNRAFELSGVTLKEGVLA